MELWIPGSTEPARRKRQSRLADAERSGYYIQYWQEWSREQASAIEMHWGLRTRVSCVPMNVWIEMMGSR